MDNFKLIVDILSSLASIIAIVTFLFVWISNNRKPIKLEHVLVDLDDEEAAYVFLVRNRRDYAITVNTCRCFAKKEHRVEQEVRKKPVIYSSFPGNGFVLESVEPKTIEPNGYDKLIYKTHNIRANSGERLFIHLDTSHGYFELCSSKVNVVTDETVLLGLQSCKTFASAFKARSYWLAKYAKYLVLAVRKS